MKTLFTIVILSLAVILEAQPTITDAVLPQVGNSATYRLFNASNVSPGQSGANATWDFSTISTNGSAIFEYKNPSSMPAGGSFPSANLGVDQNGDPQLYFEASSQELLQLGSQIATLTEDYNNNPKTLLTFPMTFGTVVNDTFEGIATLGVISATRTGTTIIEADAYGDLILPYTTFSNVLRVKSISVYEDKISGNTVNTGSDTVYSWYMEGVEDYLFTWSNITSDQFGNVLYGAYLDTMFVGLNEHSSIFGTFKLYPNPAQNSVTVEMKEVNEETLIVELFDNSSRKVKEWNLDGMKGFLNKTLSLDGVLPGCYILRLSDSKNNTYNRLIIN